MCHFGFDRPTLLILKVSIANAVPKGSKEGFTKHSEGEAGKSVRILNKEDVLALRQNMLAAGTSGLSS